MLNYESSLGFLNPYKDSKRDSLDEKT